MSKGPNRIVRREGGLWRPSWMYGDVLIAKGPLYKSKEEAKTKGRCPVEWKKEQYIIGDKDI